MKNLKRIALLAILFISFAASAQVKKKIVYKYKKFEKFDLGNLQVKGKLIAPGDLTVRQRKRKTFKRDLFQRDNFRDHIYKELLFQR